MAPAILNFAAPATHAPGANSCASASTISRDAQQGREAAARLARHALYFNATANSVANRRPTAQLCQRRLLPSSPTGAAARPETIATSYVA